jgi:Fe2+ transport system protein FeoA
MSERSLSLADLPLGASGVVASVGCPRAVARRLMEMGLLPGTRVTIVRIAPLGDPLELRLRSYALSIRREEAAAILLEDVRETVTVPAAAERAVP